MSKNKHNTSQDNLAEGQTAVIEAEEVAPEEANVVEEAPAEDTVEEKVEEAVAEELPAEEAIAQEEEAAPAEEQEEKPTEEPAAEAEDEAEPTEEAASEDEPAGVAPESAEEPESPEADEAPAEQVADEEGKAEQEEEARRLAEEKAAKKAASKAKCKAWFAKHKVLVIVLCLVVVVAGGLAAGHFISTRNVAFIHKVEDLDKALLEGKKTEYIVKTDIVYHGDLTLADVTVDMNKHTLDVKGNLTLSGTVTIGNKATVWSKPKQGGEVVVEGTYTQLGNVAWYSTLSAQSVVVAGDLAVANTFETGELTVSGALDVSGEIRATVVNVGGDLNVAGTVSAPVTIAQNATVSGTVESIEGGNKVIVQGTVGSITGADSLYLYPQCDVARFEAAHYYFVQYLEAPTVLVKKVDGNQVLLISHVQNADGYRITVDGSDLQFDARKTQDAENTAYTMPGLDPGTYTIRIAPYSDQPEVFLAGASTALKLSYYVQLATPVVTIEESVRDDGIHVIVNIQKVDYATDYVVNVLGKGQTIKVADGVTTLDITDKITDVGSYDVYVYAKPPKKGNYEKSETTLVTYVKSQSATVTVSAAAVDSGIVANIEGSNAYYYLVEWKKGGVVVASQAYKAGAEATVVDTTLTADEVDSVVVTPLGRGYYRNGEAVEVAIAATSAE